MNLAMSIAMLFVGCCLMWVAVHGTESTTPWGVFQEITKGLSGAAPTGPAGGLDGVTESALAESDATKARTSEAPGPTV